MSRYSLIKKYLLRILPRHVLFHYEYQLRYFYYLQFVGNEFRCNICNKSLRSFIEIKGDTLCPRCGSLQRTRRLWQILNEDFLNNTEKILDFSPSRSFYRLMKKKHGFYVGSDLSGDFISDVSYDIKAIDLEDQSFDLIICYHILEHIDKDSKAMGELFRVLKPGGYCIVQTPFKEGDIFEDESISSPMQREKYFGQSDHVRVYSVIGLVGRLKDVGFEVKVRNYTDPIENINGLSSEETVLICKKPI